MAHVELGEVDAARRRGSIGRRRSPRSIRPRLRARRLETWRGIVRRRCGRRRGDARAPGARGAAGVGLGRSARLDARRSPGSPWRPHGSAPIGATTNCSSGRARRREEHRTSPPGCRVMRRGAPQADARSRRRRAGARGGGGGRRPRARGGRRAPAARHEDANLDVLLPAAQAHAGHRRAGVGGGRVPTFSSRSR